MYLGEQVPPVSGTAVCTWGDSLGQTLCGSPASCPLWPTGGPPLLACAPPQVSWIYSSFSPVYLSKQPVHIQIKNHTRSKQKAVKMTKCHNTEYCYYLDNYSRMLSLFFTLGFQPLQCCWLDGKDWFFQL